jgi:hypothetical protein
MTFERLAKHFEEWNVGVYIIRHVLRAQGYLQRIAQAKPPLTEENKEKRHAVTTWVCGTNVLRNTGSQEQGILRMTGLEIEGSGDHWFFRTKDLRTHRQDRPLGEYHV